MQKNKHSSTPIIYSCSGCSNVAQLANDIAVKINTEGIAEMSCIAGIGGKVKSLVKKARSKRPIVVIDGCPLQCAKECLVNIDIVPDQHIILTDFDLKKRYGSKLFLEDEAHIYNRIVEEVKRL